MKKPRIAFVVQRYGSDVSGGAEAHCRLIVEKMRQWWEVEVLTSCAREYVKRFEPLGVITSIQPEHLAVTDRFCDNPFFERLGKEREPFFWPNRSFSDAGAVVCYGSDFPVVDIDPMKGIYRAISRVHNDGKPEGGWNPAEKVAVGDALLHYTRDPAYGSFMERDLGSLQERKLADIVVLDRNLVQCDVDMFPNVKIRMTIMDGKVVYQD